MKRISAAVLFAISLFAWGSPALTGEALDFAVIQPGQPGTSREAQPVMDSLACYVEEKFGGGITVKGRYFNDLDQALDFMRNTPPEWGIVRLGFYAQFSRNFPMTALASTRPGGSGKDVWRLAVNHEAPGEWRALRGNVLGNMLFETDAAACILFGCRAAQLPFKLKGTSSPLRSLRMMIRGKAAGVVLDRMQYEALKALPLAKKIKIILTSGELPASPMVWFGRPDERMERLAAILKGMRRDPDADALLVLLQTDGFGPPDSDLPGFRLGVK